MQEIAFIRNSSWAKTTTPKKVKNKKFFKDLHRSKFTDAVQCYEVKKIKMERISDLLKRETTPSNFRRKERNTLLYETKQKRNPSPYISRARKKSNIKKCQQNIEIYESFLSEKRKNQQYRIIKAKKANFNDVQLLQQKELKIELKPKQFSTIVTEPSYNSYYEFDKTFSHKQAHKSFLNQQEQISGRSIFQRNKKRYRDLSIREMIYDDPDQEEIDKKVQKVAHKMRSITENNKNHSFKETIFEGW